MLQKQKPAVALAAISAAAVMTIVPISGQTEDGVDNRFSQWKEGAWFSQDRNKRIEWVYEGASTLKVNRDIKHYRWIAKVGDGPFDFIRLHRYVKEPRNKDMKPNKPSPDNKKVLFIINGTWAQEGPEPLKEFDAYYFPKNGYDLWSMDFRTSFIPNLAYDQFTSEEHQAGVMASADWTYALFREDLKKSVDFAKKITRTPKLFMAGRSRGGRQLFMYAAKYADDMKGMIALDGGVLYRSEDEPEKQRSEEEMNAALAALKSGASSAPLLTEVANYENAQLLRALPGARTQVGEPLPELSALPQGAPPDGSAIESLNDMHAYRTYFAWGEGNVSNVYTPYPSGEGETYMDKDVLAYTLPQNTRYWPAVQDVEATFLTGYADNPYLDYDDTQEVTVPVIYFFGEFGCPKGTCVGLERPYATGSEDITVEYLPGFGHLDVYYGTHSEEKVKKPMLDWMNSRL